MSEETLNERIYAEEPIIAGVKVRPFSNSVKLKLARILRWLELDPETQNEEILCAFVYLIAAPIHRVSLHTLNKEAFLADKDRFLDEITTEDLKKAGEWFVTVTSLEKETRVEEVPKPSRPDVERDQPPPN